LVLVGPAWANDCGGLGAETIDSHAGAIAEADFLIIFGTRHWTPAEVAAELYFSGHSGLIITTGGSERHPKGLSEAHRDLLVAAGVPTDVVLAETSWLNTTEHVTCSLPLVEEMVGTPRSAIAIVKWYHRRALVTLAQHMPSLERAYAADYEPFDTERRTALSRSN